MSESGTLSQVTRGIDKFHSNQDVFEDWKDQLYIHVSSAGGYRGVVKILDGQERPQPIYSQLPQRRAPANRRGTRTGQSPPSRQDNLTEGLSGNDESSGRTLRSGRTTGSNEPRNGTSDGGTQEGKDGEGEQDPSTASNNGEEDPDYTGTYSNRPVNEQEIEDWDETTENCSASYERQ